MPLWMGYFLSCMKHAHTQLDPSSPLGVYEKEMPDWHDMQTTVIVGKNCRPLWNWSYFEQIETNNMAGSGRNCSSFFFFFSLTLLFLFSHFSLCFVCVFISVFFTHTVFSFFHLLLLPASPFSAFFFFSLLISFLVLFFHFSAWVCLCHSPPNLPSPPLPHFHQSRRRNL